MVGEKRCYQRIYHKAVYLVMCLLTIKTSIFCFLSPGLHGSDKFLTDEFLYLGATRLFGKKPRIFPTKVRVKPRNMLYTCVLHFCTSLYRSGGSKGRARGARAPSLFLDQTEAPRAKKVFFWEPPPPPPPPKGLGPPLCCSL